MNRSVRAARPSPAEAAAEAETAGDRAVNEYLAGRGAQRYKNLLRLQSLGPEAAAAIERQMQRCEDRARYAALGKLALRLDRPSADEVLARQAAEQRRFAGTAVRLLGKSNHPRREEMLLDLLTGSRARAASSAVQAIRAQPSAALVLEICRRALGPTRPTTRSRILQALALLGGQPGVARILLNRTDRTGAQMLNDLECMLQVRMGRGLFGFNLARFLDREASDARSPVRERAAAVRRALEDRSTLLRPASGAADTLLRPASSAHVGPADHLLRPAAAGDAPDDPDTASTA